MSAALKAGKVEFPVSSFQTSPTPDHLRIDRAEFDLRLAERRASGGTVSGQVSVHRETLSGTAMREATTFPAEPQGDSGEVWQGHPDADFQELLDSIQDSPSAGRIRKRKTSLSPERIGKQRMWDSTGQLPPRYRAAFTHGEKVVLAWIGAKIKRTGVCSFSNTYISRAVNYSVTVVKNAKRKASKLGLTKTDAPVWISKCRCAISVIRRRCSEWLNWLDRGPTGGVGRKVTGSLIIESYFLRPAGYNRQDWFGVKPYPSG